MIWAALAFLGGDVPVRVRPEGTSRWVRGHAVWVSDVFAWRGSPAAWNESLEQVVDPAERDPSPQDHTALHRLGEDPVLVTMTTPDGHVFEVATTTSDRRAALLGPFAVISGS